MTTGRRKLLLTLAVVTVSIVAGAFLLLPRSQPSRITQENFARICQGMSRAEVEAILGPPGDYRTEPTMLVPPIANGGFHGKLTPAQLSHEIASPGIFSLSTSFGEVYTFGWWQVDEGAIWICYQEGEVSMMDFAPLARGHASPVERVVWRLARMWHRWFLE